MTRPLTSVKIFLQQFLTLAFVITLLAGGFMLVEQYGHQQLLAGTGIAIPPEQTRQLLAHFNSHQIESIGVVTLIALLAALLISWYGTKVRLCQLSSEHENRQQLRKIELLLNSTAEGIYAVDQTGRCIMANRSCAQLLGYDSPDQLLNRQIHELVHHTRADGSPYPLHECKVHQIMETGTAISAFDEIFWRRDGTSLPVAYTAHPIWDDERIIGMVCTFFDVTKQQESKAQMMLLEEQLHQAQKMEAIGQLASGIAHDFNNILQVITGNAQLLQLTADTDQGVQRRLAEIVKAVDRGVKLTRSMLAFGRRQTITLRLLELNQLLVETEPLARNLLHKRQLLALELYPLPLWVTADATLLQQVLFNLVTNSRDAMPDGGTVTVGTGYVDRLPEQAIGAGPAPSGPFAVLWVRDTGHGVRDEIRNKLFEPFFTTK